MQVQIYRLSTKKKRKNECMRGVVYITQKWSKCDVLLKCDYFHIIYYAVLFYWYNILYYKVRR